MKTRKIICLLLALILIVSVLGGCSGAALATPVSNGEFIYTIVRSTDSGSVVQNAVKEIRSAIRSNLDCNVKVAKDSAVETSDDSYEILVGDTDRAATAVAKETLLNNRVNNSKDFIVKVIDKKIVIYASNEAMVEIASQWFIQTFCGSYEAFENLNSKYEFIYTHEGADGTNNINTVNNIDLGRFSVVLPRQTLYLVGRQLELYTDYMERFGYSINIGEERDTEQEYEILVGDIARTSSQSVKVEGNNFVIKVIGNKVVIKGGTDVATYRAAEEFYNIVKSSETSGTPISWSDGYTINGKYDASEKGTYTLNFDEEFDGAVVDVNKWGTYGSLDSVGSSSLGGSTYKVDLNGNCSSPDGRNRKLIYQSDGKMHIGTMLINDKDFASTDISTSSTMVYRYGYLEVAFKLADNPASSAIWANGSTFSGSDIIKRFGGIMNHSAMTEVDILENFGNTYNFHSNVHHWFNLYKADGISTSGNGHNSLDGDSRYNGKSLNNKKCEYDTVKNGDTLSDNFHIYSCYWDNTEITFAFDGKSYLTYDFAEQDMASVSCGMLYLILGCSMGSSSYGVTYNRNQHLPRYEAELDYVRIYQSDNYNCQMVYAWPQNQENGTLKYVYPEHDVNGKY